MSAPNALRRATGMDLILLATMVCMWAAAFSAIRVAVPHTGPWWLATDRVVLGFLFLLTASIFHPALRLHKSMPWGRLMAIALLNVTIPFTLISWAEQYISASLTALLMGAGPFFALGIMHVFTTDERLNPMKLVAAAVGFTGVIIVIAPDLWANGSTAEVGGSLWAPIAIMAASISYIFSGLLVRATKLNPLAMANGTLMVGSLQLIPLSLIFFGPHPTNIQTETWLVLAFLGLFPTGIAYILRYHLIQKVGYSLVVMGINALPVAGVFVAAATLGESISLLMILALACVIAGVWIARQAATPAIKTEDAV